MLFKTKKQSNTITNSTTKSNLYKLNFKYNGDSNLKKWQSQTFEIPYTMNEIEMYMILSYLLDYIKKITPLELKIFIKIDNILEKIGFFTEEYNDNEDVNILDIDDNYQEQYWYQKNITIEQVRNIYDRINFAFEISENDIKPSKKMLKK